VSASGVYRATLVESRFVHVACVGAGAESWHMLVFSGVPLGPIVRLNKSPSSTRYSPRASSQIHGQYREHIGAWLSESFWFRSERQFAPHEARLGQGKLITGLFSVRHGSIGSAGLGRLWRHHGAEWDDGGRCIHAHANRTYAMAWYSSTACNVHALRGTITAWGLSSGCAAGSEADLCGCSEVVLVNENAVGYWPIDFAR